MLLPHRLVLACVVAGLLLVAPVASASIDYGPITHSGLKSVGTPSSSSKLTLQLGLIASQTGIQNAVKSGSNPASSTYGKYPSLSTLQKNWGATSARRNGVVNAFKAYGNTAKIDVTHLRATVTVSIANAKKIFGTSWANYKVNGETVALPVNTPKPPSGIASNVDTIAGTRLVISAPSSSRAAGGGTPTRTGSTPGSCLDANDPGVPRGQSGLFPSQILTAYGIAPLQAQGLLGQGRRVAIVGEAPTPTADVNAFRSCFGFPGTALAVHDANGIQPILESSLDAQVISMVAPQLSNLDLWVQPLDEDQDDGDVEGFLVMLAQPLQATASGSSLPNVISVSYGVCEPSVQPYTAARTLVERQLAATAALGITTVVAAGDSGSSSCSRGIPPSQVTPSQSAPAAEWPATSPWVLAVGGTSLTLNADNGIASTGPWNDTVYPSPYTASAGGGGGVSILNAKPWWQSAPGASSSKRMVPDVAAFADESPGYMVVCSSGVQSCPPSSGQSIAFVGGTSAATPLVAGMIALWAQKAVAQGLPRPGFVAPLLYTTTKKNPSAFVDVTSGTNKLFPVSCCTAVPGFDDATGLGSPLADQIAALLASRG